MQISSTRPVATVSNGTTWDQNGNSVHTEGHARTLAQKAKDFLLPSDPDAVHADYAAYRKWHALANASEHTLGFLGTQGVVAGLASTLSSGIPFLGGVIASLGLSALVTYALKDGLNWVGSLVGGNMARQADEDPARWVKVSGTVKACANAAQSMLVAVPGAFLALAPLSSLTAAWADNVHGAAEVKIQGHQARRGLAEMGGKNQNQDLLTSAAGSLLGATASVVGHALLVPVLGPFAPLAVVPAALAVNVFAQRHAARALQFDTLTQTSVARMAHQALADDTIPAPGESSAKTAKVTLGGDGRSVFHDPAHRDKVLDLYGDSRYLLDVADHQVNVTFRSDATDRDVLQAAWQGQLMAEVSRSPGYASLQRQVGPEAAALQASRLTLAAAQGLDPQSLSDRGWNLGHNEIRTANVRVDWQAHPRAEPLPQVDNRALREFMQQGKAPTLADRSRRDAHRE